MNLLEQFKIEELFAQMSFADRMTAGVLVTVLGIGMTFFVLFAIEWMCRLTSAVISHVEKRKSEPAQNAVPTKKEEGVSPELLAALIAAIASDSALSSGDIRVKRIRRVPESASAWASAGRSLLTRRRSNASPHPDRLRENS